MIKCDICGKTGFKSKAGLFGHKKMMHGVDTRKTVPDEIGKRLEGIETELRILDAFLGGTLSGVSSYKEWLEKGWSISPELKQSSLKQLAFLRGLKERLQKDKIRVPLTLDASIRSYEDINLLKVEEKQVTKDGR